MAIRASKADWKRRARCCVILALGATPSTAKKKVLRGFWV
ncbi:unnamed protein product [Schistosoma mattheei]|uniref:Uncharacterized protein n=1 Tax=Schistosoma mattheei TaxID=31246 RepID=A0A3P8GIR4_9TREM|nr:unnamed protein product [Schistosoma mattheei]